MTFSYCGVLGVDRNSQNLNYQRLNILANYGYYWELVLKTLFCFRAMPTVSSKLMRKIPFLNRFYMYDSNINYEIIINHLSVIKFCMLKI